MSIADDVLMAYADGELDGQQRAEVEAALRTDATARRRVEEHRALRAKLQTSFAAELEAALPEHWLNTVRGPAAPPVPAPTVRDFPGRRARPRFRVALAMAASVVLGVGIGYAVLRPPPTSLVSLTATGLVAQGALADSLSNQVGGVAAATDRAAILLSFATTSGEYCRSFRLRDAAAAGLACREGGAWRVKVMTADAADATNVAADAPSASFRTASSALPKAVLEAIDAVITGEPLDAAAEAAARRRGWSVEPR